jgi:hypothetical protein
MPNIQAMTKQLNDQLKRESECLKLWDGFEPVTNHGSAAQNVQRPLRDDHPLQIEYSEIPGSYRGARRGGELTLDSSECNRHRALEHDVFRRNRRARAHEERLRFAPPMSRASTSQGPRRTKTWMAGTGPAMTPV